MAFKRKKLYYDALFQGTASALYFPATQFSSGLAGDRYGGLLDVLEAFTNAPAAVKARNAVTAHFVMAGNASAAALAVTNAGAGVFAVDFVQPTNTVANHALVSRLRVYVAGVLNNARAGMDSIYGTIGSQRHFSVRVRRANASAGSTSASVRGVVYIARQHSIEV